MFSLIFKNGINQILRPLRILLPVTVNGTNGHTARKRFFSNEVNGTLNRACEISTDLINPLKRTKNRRTLSTQNNESMYSATSFSDERREFLSLLPDVVREIIESVNKHNSDEVGNWFTKVLQYNVPHGNLLHGLMTVKAYKNLVKKSELTPENIKLAQHLGWCLEMLESYFVITDDIMDKSTMRRGQPCWYTVKDVGLLAGNDAGFLYESAYLLLRKHFRHLNCYVDLFELFHEASIRVKCGQALDLLMTKKNIFSFTMGICNAIAYSKIEISFYMPVALAFHLAGLKNLELLRQTKQILFDIGHLYQVQDDFLDSFGNPQVTGKIGSDVQDNKCSWLAVSCLQRANEEQRDLMVKCYGKSDPLKVAQVKELYKTLDIPNLFAAYEEETYNKIKNDILQISDRTLNQFCLQFLNNIYKRDS